ncbi:hypothetical protein [Aureimonas mangrovi]|uniref:hypothetical protein n=1 Tax=Aureimonas mangrovi TaxID=2758041 RepID=UPI00163D99FF|nr:hypothetical protein [Aureimonas mangrovi]
MMLRWRNTAMAIAGLLTLNGCAAYMPRDETPTPPPGFTGPPAPSGPSSQRLGRDGYPLIGAYPTTAGPQADQATVAATQARFANVAARAGPAGTARYDQSVSELSTLASTRQSEAAARAAEARRSTQELRDLARERQERARTP